MKRSAAALPVVALCLVAGAWITSPFFIVHQMIATAESGDNDRVFAYFDVAKVRENLRPSVSAQVQPDETEINGSPAGGFELLAAPKLADALLDSILTPAHVGDLVR